MDLPLTFAQVQARYPELISEIETARSKSKAKTRDVPLHECEWFISWGIEAKSESFEELMANAGQEPKRESLNEMIARRLDQVRVMGLVCQKGRGRWFANMPDTASIPPEIEGQIREECAARKAEEDRIDALSPEERERETQEALALLSGMGGFSHIQIPRD